MINGSLVADGYFLLYFCLHIFSPFSTVYHLRSPSFHITFSHAYPLNPCHAKVSNMQVISGSGYCRGDINMKTDTKVAKYTLSTAEAEKA